MWESIIKFPKPNYFLFSLLLYLSFILQNKTKGQIGTQQNPTGPPKYKTEQLMIRKIESQTQCLMHIPELFYRYYNCNQRRKQAHCMMTRL